MTNFTQKELENEWKRREKIDKERQLKYINIYKLPNGTYSDKESDIYEPIFTRKFFITCFMIIFIGYFLWRIMA
jgi:hypothetical protein